MTAADGALASSRCLCSAANFTCPNTMFDPRSFVWTPPINGGPVPSSNDNYSPCDSREGMPHKKVVCACVCEWKILNCLSSIRCVWRKQWYFRMGWTTKPYNSYIYIFSRSIVMETDSHGPVAWLHGVVSPPKANQHTWKKQQYIQNVFVLNRPLSRVCHHAPMIRASHLLPVWIRTKENGLNRRKVNFTHTQLSFEVWQFCFL